MVLSLFLLFSFFDWNTLIFPDIVAENNEAVLYLSHWVTVGDV